MWVYNLWLDIGISLDRFIRYMTTFLHKDIMSQSPIPSVSKEETDIEEPEEWILRMDRLLTQLQGKFEFMSSELLAKMDTMGEKITELEKSFHKMLDKHEKSP
jgi:hypothetical protein